MGKMRDVAVVSEEDKGFKTVLLGICHNLWRRLGVIGYGVMQLTSSRNPQLEAQRRQNARPESLLHKLRVPTLLLDDGESEPRAISGIPWRAPVERGPE
ncbi:hypothetical protein V6Z12_A04G178200 [Gossypium hirsutum]